MPFAKQPKFHTAVPAQSPIVRRPGVLDRMWRGNVAAGIFEEWHLPSATDLRAAIVELAVRRPDLRIGLTLADNGTWVLDPAHLPDLAERMVTDRFGAEDSAQAVLDLMKVRNQSPGEPRPSIVLNVAQNRLTYCHEHEVLDGGSLARWLSGVCDFARTGSLPTWMEGPFLRRPLPVAIRNTFSSRDQVRALLAARAEARGHGDSPELTGPVELNPRPGLLVVEMPPAARQEIRDWRKRRSPGLTDPVLTLVLMRNALRRVGLVDTPDVGMVVDLRRYLPRAERARVHQNFISGLQVHMPWPENPLQLQARLDAVLGSGRPLAAMAVSAAKATLSKPQAILHGERRFTGHPYSHVFMGSRIGGPSGDQMPWSGDQRRIVSWTSPAGLTGITAVVSHLGGGWQFNLSHYTPWTDAELLAEASALLIQNPLELLSQY